MEIQLTFTFPDALLRARCDSSAAWMVNGEILVLQTLYRFSITEKAPTSAFSWVKTPTFKTLLRHYAKRALTHGMYT